MYRIPTICLALLLAVAAIGCDSGSDDDLSDAELFVGSWALISISDSEGDQTAGFAGLAHSLTIDLNADGTFALLVDYREESGRQDLPLQGTYTVEEGAANLTLSVTALQQSLPFTYDYENDDEVTLSANALLINPVFNPTTPYEGTVEVVIRRQ